MGIQLRRRHSDHVDLTVLYFRGLGRYQEDYDRLWRSLVPQSGQSGTVQGELIRSVVRIADEYYRNGGANWDAHYDRFIEFLRTHLINGTSYSAETLDQTRADLDAIQAYGRGEADMDITSDDEDPFDRVIERGIEWCLAHSELTPRACYELRVVPVKSGHGGWTAEAVPDGCDG